ncbi:MAG: TonB-dependent receptor [Candidatus Neomarinimicrobiota bacterium]|nr:MAG: TonB-dependent receptor [Candidatus Neomarinimicrobiota bacterium]
MNRNITEKIRILIFIFLLVFSKLIYAGITGKIAGRITDITNGAPLPGANVIIEGTLIGAASDINGYYAILNMPPGTYILKVSIIGYKSVTVKNVVVKIDLTTTINVQMSTEVLGMEEVVVVAKRPLVVKDISASQLNIEAKTIESMPVADITDVIGLQAGIQGMTIRGGSSRQTAFIVDGFIQNDARSNIPYTSVSLNTVKEVQVQTGGFNAEYGNIRSGVINVVTVEGDRKNYNGAFTIRCRPPASKHFGPSAYDPNTYYTRPYLDPDVCYVGTQNGSWDKYTQEQYPLFPGWNFISESTLGDSDPSNDLTPEGARQLFKWQHRRQGDIKKPDYVFDFGFGGPVPIIGRRLGNLRFYTSYRELREMFIVPLSRDSYDENVARLKLTSDINPDMKLTFTGQYGEICSASQYNWKTTPTGSILRSDYSIANLTTSEMLYMPGWYSPADIYRSMFGIKFNHVLSSKTYYELNIQHDINRYNTFKMADRDTTKKYEVVSGYFVDEAPYGYWGYGVNSIGDNIRLGGWMNLGRDKSIISTTQFRYDFVSQLNSANQFKTGLNIVYNNYDIKSFTSNPGMTTWNRKQVYEVSPYRIGVYAQDKLEFEGFIANLGLRLDYSYANSDVYDLDEYDKFYKEGEGLLIEKEAPIKKAKPQYDLSPRLGISHPITENSKLYFNYGHFRSEPSSTYRFRIQREYNGLVTSIGNPNLEQEKTIAYELGYSHNLFNKFLLNIAAYYKDVTSQPGSVYYQNINNSVQYYKYSNNQYEDIRGLEITLDKRGGTWFTGFINYTYMVNTYGYFDLTRYYEDPNKQREYLRQNPYQERPHPRPYARANVAFHTPFNFGPDLAGIHPIGGWNMNILSNWTAGSYTTYNPSYILGAGVVDNVQWKDTYNIDLRLTKTVKLSKCVVQFFVDVTNLLNTKFLSYAGFSDSRDYDNYMKSLHFSWEEGIEKGNDRVGEYRDSDIEYIPMQEVSDISLVNDPNSRVLYYDQKMDTYFQHEGDNWVVRGKNWVDKEVLDKKAYIDMPNLEYFTFLNPRNLKIGIKIIF